MPDPDENASDPELRERLASLNRALGQAETARQAERGEAGPDKAMAGAVSSGFRAATDMAGGVIAGGLIGYVGDRWLGTSPVLLIVFLAIGTIAGLLSVYRLGMRSSGRQGGGPGN